VSLKQASRWGYLVKYSTPGEGPLTPSSELGSLLNSGHSCGECCALLEGARGVSNEHPGESFPARDCARFFSSPSFPALHTWTLELYFLSCPVGPTPQTLPWSHLPSFTISLQPRNRLLPNLILATNIFWKLLHQGMVECDCFNRDSLRTIWRNHFMPLLKAVSKTWEVSAMKFRGCWAKGRGDMREQFPRQVAGSQS
jgi:hypothetical protein